MLAPNVEPKVDVAGEILLRAADLIQREGWCKYRLQDTQGRICLYGAIIKATPKNQYNESTDGIRRLERYLKLRGPLEMVNIAVWNDNKCKNKEQAIEALRGAAWSGR